jgi:hypothetical protein
MTRMNAHRGWKVARPLFLGLFALALAFTAQAVTRDEAVAITTTQVLGGSLDHVRLFVDPQPLAAGDAVNGWHKTVLTAPAPGWFVFVDLVPGANYEHPCAYVFVDAATGACQRFEAMTPPSQLTRLIEITQGRDNPPAGASEDALARFRERLAQLPKPQAGTRGQAYAFIISGGYDSGNNHIRYWNDCAFIYTVLTEYYGYADDHIRVCISDGTNSAVDRSDGTNSPADLDGDGDPDIEYPATLTYIDQVFDQLALTLTSSDQLFIFTTDHGGQETGHDCYLNLWNYEELRDDQMAAYVAAMPCQTIICTFEQCFSGGMVDDLTGDGRIVATAANWDEYSWAMPPNYIYDEFVYYWTSAVAFQTPTGTPVDADTNNDGLVSMHEAFIYAEANDTADEIPQYSSTPANLGDIINLFGNLQGVYLSLSGVTIDDDMVGASQGDGDGVIDFQETIELTVALENMGQEDALSVFGTLACTNPYVTLVTSQRGFGSIPSGQVRSNSLPFVFRVSHDVPNAEDLGLTLTLTEDPGTLGLDLTAYAPTYNVAVIAIDDSAGDDDGVADPGETVGLTVRIANIGGAASPALDAVLLSGDQYYQADGTTHPFASIPVGQSITDDFAVTIAPECPEIHAGYLYLQLTGQPPYQVTEPIYFSVGRIFADDMETGETQWSHYAVPGGSWIDQWHLEAYRNHTTGGATSWKCGGAGSATYGNLLDAALQTVPFNLPLGSVLTFWHWIDAEASTAYPDHCYDGGLLQISIDGGANWLPLTPAGGYPYLIRAGGTPGPFPAETPVWSGTHDWQEVTVDLAGYAGQAQLRWVFGSDGAAVREGWYIDDISIHIDSASNVDGGAGAVATLRPTLLPAGPNPIVLGAASGGDQAGSVNIRFALPHAARVGLDIFDATGRLVRAFGRESLGAGSRALPWDGRDASGRAVDAGSYFYRLTIDGQTFAGRVAIVR